ncbi:MAG: hypothetical protein LBS53_08985 [Synergistaceae bacterium]|nr:hypothetical protein [Synergistaceae bacterium]
MFWRALRAFSLLAGIAAVLLSNVFSAGATTAENTAIAKDFVENAAIPEDERRVILESLAETAGSETEWMIENADAVYVAVLRPIKTGSSPGMQVRMEENARKIAQIEATRLLYLRALPREWESRYARRDAVAETMIKWDAGNPGGRQLKMNFSLSYVSGGWAFAVAKTRADVLSELSLRIEDEGPAFDRAYCDEIAPRARELFVKKRYAEALPFYKEIRGFDGGAISDYLDLADCFFAAGDANSAVLSALEAVARFGESMDSLMVERAADVLFESGDEEHAAEFYRLSCEKLHSEQQTLIVFVEPLAL